MPRIEDFLACPACEADLTAEAELVNCARCGAAWPIKNGMPVFASQSPQSQYFYDYEYCRRSMDELLSRAEQVGWMEALRTTPNKHGRPPSDYFLAYNSSLERAPWAPLLDPGPGKVVLDYGCGMGAVSAALARSFGTVLSFDAVFERARFWQIRRSQEQLANVFVFAWDGKGRPPLKAGRFDAVVMNGVLEWIPSSIMEGPPRSLQLEVLRNVCRCLRPGGRLYLAIENRFAGRYWVGHRDHHSGLRFVTVLPRPLADLYSLLVKRTPYRVHTYSLPAYRRLLSEAGFSRIHFYNAYPSYMFPKKMIPCHEERRLREAHSEKNDFESFVVRSLSRLGLGKYFVFSYGIVASRG